MVKADRRHVGYVLRGADGTWRSGTLEENDILNLDCAGHPVSLCLDDLYEDVVV